MDRDLLCEALTRLNVAPFTPQKQRSLRPVEAPAPRRAPVTASAAPFAASIARILERRSVIAYDSDSDDADNSDSNDQDW